MANYTKLKVIWKNNLNDIYKDNTIIGVGQEAVINMDENGISNIYVNFKVNNDFFTDLVKINGNVIQVPFKTDVLKAGTHQLEIVAYLKNGDVVPSPTFSYYVEKSLKNTDDIKADTHYPVLIELLEKVEEWNERIPYQEEQRIANENERKSNEINRQSNENTRQSNESSRQQYETQRRVEEDGRLTDEQVRVNAENIRIANENERLRKEIERQNAEELRQISYNSSLYGRMDEAEDRLDSVDSQLAQKASIDGLKYINVKDYGAIGDGITDDTEAIQRALDVAYKEVFFPKGTYLISNTLNVTSHKKIYGEGRNNTVIKVCNEFNGSAMRGFDISNRRLFAIKISDLSIITHLNTISPCLDLSNLSYSTLENVSVNVSGATHTNHADAIGINMTPTDTSFTFCGYNNFIDCFVSGFRHGIDIYGNDILIRGGFYNANSHIGINLCGGDVINIFNTEVSSNGRNYPSDNRYGIYIAGCNNVNIEGNWHEYNSPSATNHDFNDLFIDEATCSNINISNSRFWIPSGNVYSTDLNSPRYKTAEIDIDNGGYSNTNLVGNGKFIYKDSNNMPLGWIGNTAQTTLEEIPEVEQIQGYGSGVRIVRPSGGTNTLGFKVLGKEELKNLVGQKISFSCVLRINSGSINNVYADVALSYRDLGSGGTAGYTVSSLRVSKCNKVIKLLGYGTITQACADAGMLYFSIWTITGDVSFDLWDVAVSLSIIPQNNERSITYAGGNIITQEFKIGGCRHGFGISSPSEGTWRKGDIVYNTSPSPSSFVGWICVATGTPGTWKGFGLIES